MFKRRQPLSILQKLKEFFWPSMGWGRFFSYLKNRVIRLADSSHSLALGLAIGAGVSFSPIMGTHLIQAGILAYILRGNIVASFIGTLIGNPWTFPFIWWASMSLGSLCFDVLGFPPSSHLPEGGIAFSAFWEMLKHEPERILFPWMLGGYILCVFVTIGTYFIYLPLVKAARAARQKVRAKMVQKRLHKEAKTMTGQIR